MAQVTLAFVREFIDDIPFNRHLGLRVADLARGRARLEIPFSDELIGDPQRPALHGGVVSALIDTAGGAALWTQIDVGDRLSTVDLRVDYLRPGALANIACEAQVVRIGNRVGVVDAAVFAVREPEVILATGKGVYSIKRG